MKNKLQVSRIITRSQDNHKSWRAIDDNLLEQSPLGGIKTSIHLKNTIKVWSLVLSARSIPHFVEYERTKLNKKMTQARIFVPAMYEKKARQELYLYTQENLKRPFVHHNLHSSARYAFLILLLLIAFHFYRFGLLSIPQELLQSSDYWLELGKLSAERVRNFSEHWRSITALTLHADLGHLFSNFLFGGLFLTVLARRLGIGIALFSGVLAAIIANEISVFIRPITYSAVGFSTALFAFLGVACADMMIRDTHRKKIYVLVPLAAAMGLLAMLGTGGERTDYLSHILGLICGVLVGLPIANILKDYPVRPKIIGAFLTLLTIDIFIFAWIYAVNTN